MSTADELAKLAALKEQGVLTEAEFEVQKAKLIGQPPPGPPPTPPPPPPAGGPGSGDDDDRRKGAAFVLTSKQLLIGLLALALIGGGIGLGLWLSGRSAGASEVFLQPTNSTGANPFTPNVGQDTSVSRSISSSLPTQQGGIASYPGDSIGLYGGTLSTASCNPQQMIGYLEANPAKAAAWAAAEGISVSQIPSYISSLTPMTLRYDTRVTNHGFVNGQANPIPEILQAGQAVLVDNYGMPRARCYCGNPLTPPIPVAGPTYVGPQWPGFSPTTIIVVQQSTTVINNFTLIDNTTGTPFNRPTGTTGSSDGPAQPSPNQPTMPGANLPTTTTTVPVTAPNGQPLGTGAVQVTLSWGSVADLDLHVIEPDGTEIYYGNRTSADGGTLDVDSNGGCSNLTSSPVENVYWTNAPPSGTYTARVNFYGDCGAGSPQSFTITVKINSRIVLQQHGTVTDVGSNADFPFTVG